MKSTVENMNPTRVRITVEVPFSELKTDFDRAYKELAKKVRLPGFRPGKAPAKLLEARIGRGAVLEQVVNDALPTRYREAVSTNELHPLGQPDIDITKIEDGQELIFTAEVDIRPQIDLPDVSALNITVDAIELTDSDVDTELAALRARFGTLVKADRPARHGDIVSMNLSGMVDGQDLPDAQTEGLSHELGSGQLIDGLDEAVIGMSEGESTTFQTTLIAGEYAGKNADVTVTLVSVKERELPEVDDEFAAMASEFDTVEELRTSLQDKVRRDKRVEQAEKIRDNTLELLLEQVEVALPEKFVQAHIDQSMQTALQGVGNDEAKLAEMLQAQGSSREKFDADTRETAEKAVKTQLLMDAIADELAIKVSQNDISQRLMLMSRQYGIEPQQLLQALQQNNRLPAIFADVRRSLTVAAVVEAASVTDTAGQAVDTSEFFGSSQGSSQDSDADTAQQDDSDE